jgi:pyrroloquinoline-quinone synthase
MTTEATLAELDARIAARSILQHPFYRAWSAGTLTRADLATYARVYYPHVAAFPDYLRAAIDGAKLPTVQAELRENLREEESEPRPHAELWLAFAAAVGADPEAIRVAEPAASTREVVADFRRLCGASTDSALAALYAYESQQPEVSEQKAVGLRERYGIEDASALAYFTVHSEADRRHRDGERRAIARCLEAGASGEEVLAAADAALDAYWRLLDGVCAETMAA